MNNTKQTKWLRAFVAFFSLCWLNLLPAAESEVPGKLYIGGGGLSNATVIEVIGLMLENSLDDRPIGIFSTGSSDASAASTGANFRDRINNAYGPGTAIYIHITESNDGGDDPANVALIESCGAFWFTGGSQTSIMRGFFTDNGRGDPRPAFDAMMELHAQGAPIGGSSAGAAIMSDPMISGGTSSNALARGATPAGAALSGVSYRKGMGLLPDVLVDQHFIERGRLGRLLAGVASPIFNTHLGIGIAEDTALVVDQETRIASLVGGRGAIIIDASEMVEEELRQMTGIKIHYLDRGDAIHLDSGELFFADGKVDMQPSAPAEEISVGAWGTDAIYNLITRLGNAVDTESAIASDTNFDLIFSKTEDTRVLRQPDEAAGSRPTWAVTNLDLAVLRRGDQVEEYLHDWQFEDEEGTELSATLNSARPWVNWNGNYANSFTTGEGTFRIQRNDAGLNRRVDVGDTGGAEMLYMLVEFAGWNFSNVVNEAAGEIEMRLHFMNGEAADNPSQITAGMRLIHDRTAGTVLLQADSTGTAAPGGETSDPVSLFSDTLDQNLALLTEYDTVNHFYTVYYRLDDGPWETFFEGNTSGVRAAISFRMWIRGDFDGNGENFMDLNRFAIATVFPSDEVDVPEDGISPWDDLETITEDGIKDTPAGLLVDKNWPWVYHVNSLSWVRFFTGYSEPEEGFWGYDHNNEHWIWTHESIGSWIYVYGEEPGWTEWTTLGTSNP